MTDMYPQSSEFERLDGGAIRCLVCGIVLTSHKMYDEHSRGKNHLKRRQLMFPTRPTNETVRSDTTLHVATAMVPGDAAQDSSITDSEGARCEVCDVIFTSRAHANQHLSGKKHLKNMEERILLQELKRMTLKEASINTDVVAANSDVDETSLKQVWSPNVHAGSQSDDTEEATCALAQYTEPSTDDDTLLKTRLDPLGDVTPSPLQADTANNTQERSLHRLGHWCDVCSVPLNSAAQLEIHEASQKHKKKQAAQQQPASGAGREPKLGTSGNASLEQLCPWLCTFCGKRVNTREQLKIHLQTTASHKALSAVDVEKRIQDGAPGKHVTAGAMAGGFHVDDNADDVSTMLRNQPKYMGQLASPILPKYTGLMIPDNISRQAVAAPPMTFTCDRCQAKVSGTVEEITQHKNGNSKKYKLAN